MSISSIDIFLFRVSHISSFITKWLLISHFVSNSLISFSARSISVLQRYSARAVALLSIISFKSWASSSSVLGFFFSFLSDSACFAFSAFSHSCLYSSVSSSGGTLKVSIGALPTSSRILVSVSTACSQSRPTIPRITLKEWALSFGVFLAFDTSLMKRSSIVCLVYGLTIFSIIYSNSHTLVDHS